MANPWGKRQSAAGLGPSPPTPRHLLRIENPRSGAGARRTVLCPQFFSIFRNLSERNRGRQSIFLPRIGF
jgi:hypothetical protein